MALARALLVFAAVATGAVACSSGDVTFGTSTGSNGSGAGSSAAPSTGSDAGSGGTTGGAGGAGGTSSSGSSGSGGAGTATAVASTSTTAATSATSSSATGGGGCQPVMCQGKIYACANCLDDDGDGNADAADSNCVGPCDNSEDKLDLAIPGANNAPCKRDCYFDQDSGSGNDNCSNDLRCDPLSPDPIDCKYTQPPPASAKCSDKPSATCLKVCLPLTPNGCDCFGCCEVPGGGGKFVYIGTKDANDVSTCTIENAADPKKCAPCTPVKECFKDCGKCELCLGKNAIPPECSPSDQCPDAKACGLVGQAPCPPGEYCITGCCQVPGPN